jgi:hypothetical protein
VRLENQATESCSKLYRLTEFIATLLLYICITHHIGLDLHPQAYESPIFQCPRFHYGILCLHRQLYIRRTRRWYPNLKFRRRLLHAKIRRLVPMSHTVAVTISYKMLTPVLDTHLLRRFLLLLAYKLYWWILHFFGGKGSSGKPSTKHADAPTFRSEDTGTRLSLLNQPSS